MERGAPRRPAGRRTAGLLAIMAATWISCGSGGADDPGPGEPTPAPRTWPADTALAVNDRAIPAAEIDRVAAWVALLEPAEVPTSHRRSALTHVVLERAALAVAHPEARAEERRRAEALLAALEAGEEPDAESGDLGPHGRRAVAGGTWDDLGLVAWGEAREAPLGSWHGPVEDSGRWLLLKPLEHVRGKVPGADLYRIEAITLPFVPADLARPDVEAAIDDALLEVVDPAWASIVPAAWRYRMNGPD